MCAFLIALPLRSAEAQRAARGSTELRLAARYTLVNDLARGEFVDELGVFTRMQRRLGDYAGVSGALALRLGRTPWWLVGDVAFARPATALCSQSTLVPNACGPDRRATELVGGAGVERGFGPGASGSTGAELRLGAGLRLSRFSFEDVPETTSLAGARVIRYDSRGVVVGAVAHLPLSEGMGVQLGVRHAFMRAGSPSVERIGPVFDAGGNIVRWMEIRSRSRGSSELVGGVVFRL